MRKIINYLLIILALSGIGAAATLFNSYYYTPERVQKAWLEDCDNLHTKILKHLEAANYCIEDGECKAYSLFCPWGSDDNCTYVLANHNHSLSLVANDIYRFNSCIAQVERFQELYGHCKDRPETPEKYCPALKTLSFKCVDRRCVEASN